MDFGSNECIAVGVNNSEYEVLDRSSPAVSPMKSTSESTVPESLMSSRKLEVSYELPWMQTAMFTFWNYFSQICESIRELFQNRKLCFIYVFYMYVYTLGFPRGGALRVLYGYHRLPTKMEFREEGSNP
jgi:hypothetical protein